MKLKLWKIQILFGLLLLFIGLTRLLVKDIIGMIIFIFIAIIWFLTSFVSYKTKK
ncbi:hypothetical protein [Clostridium caldaquaticum]|uniref:hypothetical protein n=1 Tax=Clostridium caldaquaticum TaxID=2940653 RepID=UPI00207705DC|nr:hypothetical protein [Clostridium caldaquaticum]